MYLRKDDPIDNTLPLIGAKLKYALEASKFGVDIEIKEHKNTRSNAQNSFYWMSLKDVAGVLNEAGCTYGEYKLPYTKDLVHEINKKIFDVETTTRLSVGDFLQYMTQITTFWIDRTRGHYMPKETAYSYLERTGFINQKQRA